MKTQSSAETRVQVREQVVAGLRRDIVRGRLSPGQRIPPQIELARRLGVSGVTVQHAIGRLVRDGFLYTRPRRGTFVTQNPPHLHHYGITFHGHPSDQASWVQFWVALSHEAVRMQQTTRSDLSLFYGINAQTEDEVVRNASLDNALTLAGEQ